MGLTSTTSTIAALLERLDRAGVHLSRDHAGRLVTDAPVDVITDDLADAIRSHRELLVWAVYGRQSGHRWVPCTSCGEATMTAGQPAHGRRAPQCRLTLGCNGRYIEVTP